MRYWCSRKHDWEGVLTTANDNLHEKEASDVPTVETQNTAEEDQHLHETVEGEESRDISGFFVYSQLVFIENKNNGLGDMREPTMFWTKKSSHIVFRRPLNL